MSLGLPLFVFAVGAARAGVPEVASTTTVVVRPDMTGQPYVSGWETAWAAMGVGAVRLETYGDLGWPAGVDQPIVPELYVLSADGDAGPMDWTLGRTRIDLPTFGRMLDGGRIAWSPSDAVRLEAWAGQARHVGLDGVWSGAPIARVAATVTRGDLAAIAGVWGELGDAPAVHPDLRVRWRDTRGRVAPDVSLLAAVGAGAGGAVLERGRIEASLRPVGGVRALLYGEHRAPLSDPSPLGPSILATFAPDGVDQVGAGVGWTDIRRSQLWIEGSLQAWADPASALPGSDEDVQLGVTTTVSWRPTCPAQSWCASPSWRGASGPGGVYSAVGTTVWLPVPDPLTLSVHGMVVPYRKPHLAWDTALVVGGTLEVHPSTSLFSVVAGGEIARDIVANIDPRGWLSLRVGRP